MSTATETPLATVTGLLHDWCAARADRVKACYVEPMKERDTWFRAVLVQRYDPHDFELTGELSAFVIATVRAMNLMIHTDVSGPDSEEEVDWLYGVRRMTRIFGG